MDGLLFKPTAPGPVIHNGATVRLIIHGPIGGRYNAYLYYPTDKEGYTTAFNLNTTGKRVAAVFSKNFSPPDDETRASYYVMYDIDGNHIIHNMASAQAAEHIAVHGIYNVCREMLFNFMCAVLDAVRSSELNGNLVLMANEKLRVVDSREHIEFFVYEL